MRSCRRFLTRTGAGAYSFQSLTNGITLGNLAQQTVVHHQVLVLRIEMEQVPFVDQDARRYLGPEDLLGALFEDRADVQASAVELLWRDHLECKHGLDLIRSLPCLSR
ncbi:hypothetical protein [Burkholderia anthina]|uniref:hypothetical protein n=1 Tax=Burkholderia anthina TaxID=179879 RepID=UPI001588FDCA